MRNRSPACIWASTPGAVFLLGDGYRIPPTEGFVAEIERLLSANALQLR